MSLHRSLIHTLSSKTAENTKKCLVNKKLLSSYCYQLCKKGKAVWVSQSIEKFRRWCCGKNYAEATQNTMHMCWCGYNEVLYSATSHSLDFLQSIANTKTRQTNV